MVRMLPRHAPRRDRLPPAALGMAGHRTGPDRRLSPGVVAETRPSLPIQGHDGDQGDGRTPAVTALVEAAEAREPALVERAQPVRDPGEQVWVIQAGHRMTSRRDRLRNPLRQRRRVSPTTAPGPAHRLLRLTFARACLGLG